jgi:hypothetical protein
VVPAVAGQISERLWQTRLLQLWFAQWRDLILASTMKLRSLMGLYQIS